MHGLRVDERNLSAEEATARRGVDQGRALVPKAGELRRQILDLVGEVVHARTAPGEEPADRCVGGERCEQLDLARADEKGRGLDALLALGLAPRELGAEQALVALDRLVEVLDGNADVVHALHEPEST